MLSCTGKEKVFTTRFEGESAGQKWSVKDLNRELPSDLSTFKYLTLDLRSSTAQRFTISLYDTGGVRRLSIHPFQNAWVRASVPLIHFKQRNVVGADMASISKTPLPGCWIGFTGNVGTISNVDSLGVEMWLPIGSQTLEIRNVRLTMESEDSILSPIPIIDQFGQWIPAEWAGKAATIDDLRSSWEEEDRALQQSDMSVSRYGGFLDKRVKATGFFRVEEIDGRWWFVDPEGYLFFSTGSCVISPVDKYARAEGREYIFTKPPESQNQTGTKIDTYSYYTWNLYRRFGPDWYQKWMDHTARRMDNWGINTIANWSDDAFSRSQRKPYVVQLGGFGFNAKTMGMPDVYAPDYTAAIEATIAHQCTPLKNDPFLIGYFIGNEPPWPERPQEVVNVILSGPETPLQSELKKYLENEDTPERRRSFVIDTYSKFTSVINDAIRKHDPNHMNLGFRFGGSAPEEIIKASVGFDVFSINVYGYSVTPDVFQRIDDFTGLPVIIGEFHFGIPERGFAPGLAQVSNQEERGVAYRYYVENAAAHPNLIGTHWFIWTDQAPTGRYDGENYNIGFVDVTDRPYRELVDAASETHKRLYKVHSGIIPPVNRQAKVQ